MRLVIRSVSVWGHPNIRTWEPEDPETVAELVLVDVGDRAKEAADTFTIRVATPAGLARLEARDGVLATRQLLVLQRYDFDVLRRWLEATVQACEAGSWTACVDQLRRHFGWQYDGYEER